MGDCVFLKLTPRQGDTKFGVGNLAPRYIGLFKILERVENVVYCLNLPPQLGQVHNVCHIAMFRKYTPDPLYVIQWVDVPIEGDVTYEENSFKYLGENSKCLEIRKFQLSRFFGSTTKKRKLLGSLRVRCWGGTLTYLSLNLLIYIEFRDEILLMRVGCKTPSFLFYKYTWVGSICFFKIGKLSFLYPYQHDQTPSPFPPGPKKKKNFPSFFFLLPLNSHCRYTAAPTFIANTYQPTLVTDLENPQP